MILLRLEYIFLKNVRGAPLSENASQTEDYKKSSADDAEMMFNEQLARIVCCD